MRELSLELPDVVLRCSDQRPEERVDEAHMFLLHEPSFNRSRGRDSQPARQRFRGPKNIIAVAPTTAVATGLGHSHAEGRKLGCAVIKHGASVFSFVMLY